MWVHPPCLLHPSLQHLQRGWATSSLYRRTRGPHMLQSLCQQCVKSCCVRNIVIFDCVNWFSKVDIQATESKIPPIQPHCFHLGHRGVEEAGIWPSVCVTLVSISLDLPLPAYTSASMGRTAPMLDQHGKSATVNEASMCRHPIWMHYKDGLQPSHCK